MTVPDQDALDRATAMGWIARWEIQQQGYLPDREDRFTALIDAVEEAAGRPDPLVLDLGCGPGSLSVRLLDRIPAARVIAIDTDPVLLALGRAAYGQRDGLRFADVDLRSNGWTAELGLDRPADAAVSTTALHWLRPQALHVMYARLATALRPGGLLLDGDHLKDDPAAVPTLARLGQALIEREERRRFPDGLPESWAGLVGGDQGGSRAGRPAGRARAAQAERGPPRVGVRPAGHARGRAARRGLRRDRDHLAARREPHPGRRPRPLTFPPGSQRRRSR